MASIEESGLRDNSEEQSKRPVLDFLAEKYEALQNDYHTPDGKFSENCGGIAEDVAKILLVEGKRPIIISITSRDHEILRPLRYKGRVSFGGHIACACDGLVYDPLVGKPLPIDEYIREAFGEEVNVETKITEDRIEEFVNK